MTTKNVYVAEMTEQSACGTDALSLAGILHAFGSRVWSLSRFD